MESTQLPLPIIKRVVRTGNSLAVVVPAKFVQQTGIRSGDKVNVTIDYEAGTITYKFLSVRQLNLV
jgi:antitoxin component of MazEF toxin-antitoxin module